MAGVQAASEAALLLDFLGHVCCGVSRRRPLQGMRGQRFENRRQRANFIGKTPRATFRVCAPSAAAAKPFLAFSSQASVPDIFEHAGKLSACSALRLPLWLSLLFSCLFPCCCHSSCRSCCRCQRSRTFLLSSWGAKASKRFIACCTSH